MAETLRALSVRQPWAIAICHGKDVENRPRPTSHRGLVAIHAAKAPDDTIDMATITWIGRTIGLSVDQMLDQDHRGAVVAVAEIVGCHLHSVPGGTCSPWAADGRWHWQLANVHPLPRPIPARGALGLWRLPDDIDAAVRQHLTST